MGGWGGSIPIPPPFPVGREGSCLDLVAPHLVSVAVRFEPVSTPFCRACEPVRPPFRTGFSRTGSGSSMAHRDGMDASETRSEGGKKHVRVSRRWPNGGTYVGGWKGGKPHGHGTWKGNEAAYVGAWKEGEPHGAGKVVYAKGDVYEGAWNQGAPHGIGKYLWKCQDGESSGRKGGGTRKNHRHPSLEREKEPSRNDASTYHGRDPNLETRREDTRGSQEHRADEINHQETNGEGPSNHGTKNQVEGAVSTSGNGSGIRIQWDKFRTGSWSRNVDRFKFPRELGGRGTAALGGGLDHHDEYSGEWAHGKRHGAGTQLWSSGALYDGFWEHDQEHGPGMYVDSRDHSAFHGTWSHGQRHGTGLWMPEAVPASALRSPWTNTKSTGVSQRSESSDSRFGDGATGTSTQRPKPRIEHYENGKLIWTAPATEEDVKGVLRRTYPPSQELGTRRNSLRIPGETVYKGHRSYDLVRSLQLGLRYSVLKMSPPKGSVTRTDGVADSNLLNLPDENIGKDFVSVGSMDFKWKDYCPMAFSQLRTHFGIDGKEYIESLCGEHSLREMSSPGKSVSMFYLTRDGRFMIKTICRAEVNFLRSMLPTYYRHVKMNRGTLVTKFFGLHRIEPQHGKKVRFVVMGNLFRTDLQLQRRFDLKGSTLGRFSPMHKYSDETCTLKDLDLNCRFQLNPIVRQRFLHQLALDCELLEALSVMDYSLLVGVHFIDRNAARAMMRYRDKDQQEGRECADQQYEQPLSMNANAEIAIASTQLSKLSLLGQSAPESRSVGIQMSAQLVPGPPSLVREEGGPTVECPLLHTTQVLLYCGIIDILQEFNARKHIEASFKASVYGKLKISAADPKTYRQRFESFLNQVFC